VIHRRNQSWRPIDAPNLLWSARGLESVDYGDVYYSDQNGLAESQYTFIEGNRLPQRFNALAAGEIFTISELGFGSGLNFALTVRAWLQRAPTGAQLHYLGIDHRPLRREDFARSCDLWPDLAVEFSALRKQWPAPVPGCHRILMPTHRITLDLWWEDGLDALLDLASHQTPWVNAWFLDGFAPSKNPDMWNNNLCQPIASLSADNATFATFTAAGHVRRALTEVGFAVEKTAGFGRKRDSLRGTLSTRADLPLTVTPWDLATSRPRPQTAIVIGAGLAGSWCAHTLAERGLQVTVIEANGVADAGSGNKQGLTYTRLSRRFGDLSDFALVSYCYAVRRYSALLSEANDPDLGAQCGFIQLSDDDETLAALQSVLDEPHLAAILDGPTVQEILGLPTQQRGVHFPEALWLNPPMVCRRLLDHANITVLSNTGFVSLQNTDSSAGWSAHSGEGVVLASADIAVLANARNVIDHPDADWLPLQTIRGQVTQLPTFPPLSELETALCHQGYLPPPIDGQHWLGASYGPNDDSLEERIKDHEFNLAQLQAAVPNLVIDTAPGELSGRVGHRCNSIDYLPIVGPVPDRERCFMQYASLAHRKTERVADRVAAKDGLFVLTALGSRGLTAAPLCAQWLADQILNRPPALPRYLTRALAPARFIVRDIARGRTTP
jgi:tRNA 5-methylaminomethyl-2-thiouridine biosynthesis bifunctional protein